jgi:Domain of unknown function (DUF4082)
MSRLSRRITCLAAGVAVALVSVTATASAQASDDAGLWPADYTATGQDCGSFGPPDGNGFCSINDNGSVELGVKFTPSNNMSVLGVRAYRTDSGPVTGSLWDANGNRLAGPANFAGTATHDWQEATFNAPVTIEAGKTYIASYYAPNADYAFEWDRFTNGSYIAGPITAKQSVAGDGNGVFCYDNQVCEVGFPAGFPADTFRDTNYWVSPLWPSYDYTGFYQPVDNKVWNGAKAGSAIPVKFSLGGDQGLAVLNPGFPKVTEVTCPGSSSAVDAIEQTVTASASSLSYDASADQYVYNWKTSKGYAGKCYQFDLGLNDGSSHTFTVQFTK